MPELAAAEPSCAVCGTPIEPDPWGSPGVWHHQDQEGDRDGEDAVLDDLVQDVAGEQASAANNSGLRAQVEFLRAHGSSARDIEAEWQARI